MVDISVNEKLTLAETVRAIFGIEVSKHLAIKHALNSLIKGNVIGHTKEALGGGLGSRSRILIHRDQLDLVHNAVVLQGLFSDTKSITKLLKDQGYRIKMADFAKTILVGRQSIVGVSLLPAEVSRFLDMLASDTDLRTHRLPQPFLDLPQLVLEAGTSTIQALLAQSSALSAGDTMMAHYFNGDLELARQAAQSVTVEDNKLDQFKRLIEREYAEAKEFDDLLDILK
jgi:hypothetical protein